MLSGHGDGGGSELHSVGGVSGDSGVSPSISRSTDLYVVTTSSTVSSASWTPAAAAAIWTNGTLDEALGGGGGLAPTAEEEATETLSPGAAAGVGLLLVLIVSVSVAGNALVCAAIARDRKLRKIGNLFLVSLAAADLMVSCLVMPFAAVNDLLGYWPFAERFCVAWVSLDVLSATASILHLCAISLDRYAHMRAPFRYEAWMTTARCAALIGLTWLTAVLISVVPVNLGWHASQEHIAAEEAAAAAAAAAAQAPTRMPVSTTTSLRLGSTLLATSVCCNSSEIATVTAVAAASDGRFSCSFDVNPTYAIVSSAISFYIPCAIMLSIYCKMYALARRHLRKIKSTTKQLADIAIAPVRPDPVDAAQGGGGGGGGGDLLQLPPPHPQPPPPSPTLAPQSPRGRAWSAATALARRSLRENKAMFTLGVILGAFLVSWSPFFAVNVTHALCRCVPHRLFQALTWLGYFNSAQNPVIYSIFNADFRQSFLRILRCRGGRRRRRRADAGDEGRGAGGGDCQLIRATTPAAADEERAAVACADREASRSALQPLLAGAARSKQLLLPQQQQQQRQGGRRRRMASFVSPEESLSGSAAGPSLSS